MKMKLKIACALLATAPIFAAHAAAENYTLDPTHTYPNFAVEHWGLSMMQGRFDKSSGKFSIDRTSKSGSAEITIETVSVGTGNAKNEPGSPEAAAWGPRSRDEHLRSGDFFNAKEFPSMTFKSTKVVFSGDLPSTVEGNFTMLGLTKPLTLSFERFKCGQNRFSKKDRCGGNAVGKFKRSDFGMKTAIPAVGDEITLNIEFEGDKD